MAVVAPARFDGLQSVSGATATSSGAWHLHVGGGGAAPCTLTGDYYATTYTGEAVPQLLQGFILSCIGAGANVAGTFDVATGVVTLTNNDGANTLTITFDGHTAANVIDIGVMLGLIASTVGATPSIGPIAAAGGTFVGPYQHYYGWFPDRCTSEVDGRIDREGVKSVGAAVTQTRSGRIVSTRNGAVLTSQPSIKIGKVSVDRVLTSPTAQTFTSYEQFWERVLASGQRFRYYAQRTQTTAPIVYVADKRTQSGGTTTATVRRVHTFYGELMSLDIGAHVYV